MVRALLLARAGRARGRLIAFTRRLVVLAEHAGDVLTKYIVGKDGEAGLREALWQGRA